MKSSSIIPLIIGILLFVLCVFWYFSTGTGNQAALTAIAPTNEAQTQFQALFSELTAISFNTDIFSDSRFNALVDLTTPIAPESTGRLDPFAAITSMSIVVNTGVTIGNTAMPSVPTTTPTRISTSTPPRTSTTTIIKLKK